LVLLLAVTVAAGIASAQNATLGGTVMDETGAVIPGAVIIATGNDTGVETRTTANNAGNYQFPSLQPGSYKVSATTEGFNEVVYNPIALGVSANVRRNFTLSISEVATVVEVAAAAESPLMASGAVVGSVLPRQQIEDLPLVDRSAANLALTQAGIDGGIGEGVSVAGASTMALAVTVDGISVSNTRISRAGGLHSFQLSQSVDLVEEVKVTSSPADAEFGRSVGRVEMITRSGTNQFHGSVTDGFRNNWLNANTYWNNRAERDRAVLKRNQYAARISGPIIRNKTFFFFLYDGDRERTEATTVHQVLTASAREGNYRYWPGVQTNNAASSNPAVDFNGNPIEPDGATGALQTVSVFGVDPNRPNPDPSGLANTFLAKIPLPNNFTESGDGLNTAAYVYNAPGYHNKDQFTGKVDHTFNAAHMMNVTFTKEKQKYTNSLAPYPGIADEFGYNNVPSWFLSANLTSTLTPSVVNMFKFGFQHPDMDQRGGLRVIGDLYPEIDGQPYEPGFAVVPTYITSTGVDSRLVNPVYTVGNNTSWLRGAHSLKWGFQFDHMESNSWNIFGYVPSVRLGAGNVPVQGIDTLPGMISNNEGTMEDMLVDFTGSVSSASHTWRVASGKDLTWIQNVNEGYWNQRSLGFYFKDDWKVTPNVTLNLGLRWDWTGAPNEQKGRTIGPKGGFSGLFGISGTNYDVMWAPGASGGSLTEVVPIGNNSSNPDYSAYDNYYKGFGPAIGLSWSIPYFGQDKTVLRIGYQISRPMASDFLGISGDISSMSSEASWEPTEVAFLDDVFLPIPATTEPLEFQPINSKLNSLNAYDPGFQPPTVQNYNASIERQLTPSTSFSIRYVGNHSSHLNNSVPINAVNVIENGLYEAGNITAAGGDAPILDRLFAGVDFGSGIGVVGEDGLTGSSAVRQYRSTQRYFAGNDARGFASWINTSTDLQPSATASRGGIITQAGLPANFVVVNPQYSGVNATTSGFNAHYDSGIFELNRRTTNGWGYQVNFTWAKNYNMSGLAGGWGGSTSWNPRDFSEGGTFGGRKHSLKISGTYELPFGPGKLVNLTGVADKILGGWQFGGFLTVNSGSYLSIGGANGGGIGGVNTPVVVGDLPENPGKIVKTGGGPIYFGSEFQRVDDDRFCDSITTVDGLQDRCGEYAMAYNGSILFQNSLTGEMGTLGRTTQWLGPGLVNLDLNLLKRLQVTERVSAELRLDAISAPNTPHFGNPNTSMNSSSFGVISEPRIGGNAYTSPASYYGNRILVINARVSF